MGAWAVKYMGSKRRMLENGLGQLLCEQAGCATRVVDLFCGAGSVSWYAAENTELPVLAIDLQVYAAAMALAVIGRDKPLDGGKLSKRWISKAKRRRSSSRLFKRAREMEGRARDVPSLVGDARDLCGETCSRMRPIWSAYGGYYFSPSQAITFDYMLRYLPADECERWVCLAATISAASMCAASPGHTAQPFRPTESAGRFILEAWSRDPLQYCQRALDDIGPRHAQVRGAAVVGDAVTVVESLGPDDLVVIDPPYSGVQYSRFYHVLETMARGQCGGVSGAGRYPPFAERPQSDFSRKTTSRAALRKLFEALSAAGSTVIVTFPSGECSNGLSGEMVTGMARAWFTVEKRVVSGQFSTLGGNNAHRAPRKPSSELMLLLRPRT